MVAPVKQVFPRHRGVFETWGFSGTVPLAMAPRFKFAQELRPVGFGLADEDHVRVRLCFIGHQSYMGSTQDHRSSPLPELVCHGIRVRRTRGMKGNRYQVH